jgi:hypothetical protein
MQIDYTCDSCKKDFLVDKPNLCNACFCAKVKERYPQYSYTKKKLFWHEAKRFAYSFLSYVPIAVFINLRFGIWYEMAFLGGMLWLSFMSIAINWLMRKF